MKRLTYKTVGDAANYSNYDTVNNVPKFDLIERLGKLEDIVSEVTLLMVAVRNAAEAGDGELLRRACAKVEETLKGVESDDGRSP